MSNHVPQPFSVYKNSKFQKNLYVPYPVRAHFLRCRAIQLFEGPHKNFVIRQPVFLHQYRDRFVGIL